MTSAELCNVALGLVGDRAAIDSLEEDTPQAQACRVSFALVQQAFLEVHRWSFARKRAALAVLADVERTGWTYVYALPTDCIATRYLVAEENQGELETAAGREPFELDVEGDARILLTNQASAELVYTRAPPVALWTGLAREAFAYKLAAHLALSLPVKPALGEALERVGEIKLSRARAADINQQQRSAPAESEFITARS